VVKYSRLLRQPGRPRPTAARSHAATPGTTQARCGRRLRPRMQNKRSDAKHPEAALACPDRPARSRRAESPNREATHPNTEPWGADGPGADPIRKSSSLNRAPPPPDHQTHAARSDALQPENRPQRTAAPARDGSRPPPPSAWPRTKPRATTPTPRARDHRCAAPGLFRPAPHTTRTRRPPRRPPTAERTPPAATPCNPRTARGAQRPTPTARSPARIRFAAPAAAWRPPRPASARSPAGRSVSHRLRALRVLRGGAAYPPRPADAAPALAAPQPSHQSAAKCDRPG